LVFRFINLQRQHPSSSPDWYQLFRSYFLFCTTVVIQDSLIRLVLAFCYYFKLLFYNKKTKIWIILLFESFTYCYLFHYLINSFHSKNYICILFYYYHYHLATGRRHWPVIDFIKRSVSTYLKLLLGTHWTLTEIKYYCNSQILKFCIMCSIIVILYLYC